MRHDRTDDRIVRNFLETSAKFLLEADACGEVARDRCIDSLLERISRKYRGAESRV